MIRDLRVFYSISIKGTSNELNHISKGVKAKYTGNNVENILTFCPRKTLGLFELFNPFLKKKQYYIFDQN